VLAAFLPLLLLAGGARPPDPPVVLVTFTAESQTVLGGRSQQARQAVSAAVLGGVADHLRREFPFLRWTTTPGAQDYTLALRIHRIGEVARGPRGTFKELISGTVIPAGARAAAVRDDPCRFARPDGRAPQRVFDVDYRLWSDAAAGPPRADEIVEKVREALAVDERRTALLDAIRLPFEVAFRPPESRATLRARADALQADVIRLRYRQSLLVRNGANDCRPGAIYVSGEVAPLPDLYVVGRISQVEYGLDRSASTAVLAGRQLEPIGTYFRAYFRRSDLPVQNGVVTGLPR
jgi:hypothetical protein